ncbi:hypothetical protein [Microvirga massiliensis]|uniref:hypothetical protein n=1 Tax=Microvirga massiliensis TaxID=1033741 RepID=UPI00062B7DD5|nr:hypothetical protein [Microvirga massiliensis]
MTKMKSETLPEARDRLKEMSEIEKRGAEAVAEGQIQPVGHELDPDQEPEPLASEHMVDDRIRPASADVKSKRGGEPMAASQDAKPMRVSTASTSTDTSRTTSDDTQKAPTAKK